MCFESPRCGPAIAGPRDRAVRVLCLCVGGGTQVMAVVPVDFEATEEALKPIQAHLKHVSA